MRTAREISSDTIAILNAVERQYLVDATDSLPIDQRFERMLDLAESLVGLSSEESEIVETSGLGIDGRINRIYSLLETPAH